MRYKPLNQADGPMRKIGSRMVPFLQDKLAVFGGYGIPIGLTQPGAMFTKNTDFTDGRGLSNELHVFNITEGMWGQYYLHMMRDRQQVSVCSIGCKEYLNNTCKYAGKNSLTITELRMLVKQVVLLHLSQASGPPQPPLALDHLPVAISLSLPLTTTRQCSLQVVNQNVAESVTATSWILSQWYAQKL